MPTLTIALVAAIMLAVALPLLVWGLVPARAGVARERLAAPVRPAAPTEPATLPRALQLIASPASRARLERSIALAGLTQTWPIRRVLRAKLLATGVALALAVVFVVPAPGLPRLVLALAFLAGVYLLPDVVIGGRARERQEVIRHELADALDEITISIEAGLSLETAVSRAGEFGKGPLAQELTRTVQDMRVGFSRKEAYLALADRTSVPDLRRFARAVMQADQYGVSVGHVVRVQAKELRAKRRQRAEERAMKVPVQVLFPLMFCILPVLFVVVLGPAVINLAGVIGDVPR
ncbi:MAG TPA: type II secretion system F family protein [Pseudolysinimonas sp.]|nr:type II secretion system F family protein [Pseudolysinimonas sp.]